MMRKLNMSLCFLLSFGLIAMAVAAQAQDYPSKPIRLIVPFGTGGATDTSGRALAEALERRINQRIVVENRAGAGGNIGTELVAQSSPDGYTLLLALDATMVVNPFTLSKVPFDTIKDFGPVTKLGDVALVLAAHPSLPAKNLAELLAYSKAHPNKLSYASGGNGSTTHVAGELLKQRTGLDMQHVAYKSGGLAVLDAVGGQVQLTYSAAAGSNAHIRAGRLVGIGVSTTKRIGSLPDVPTFIEQGLSNFEAVSWVGIMAPAKTPRPIIDRLHAEITAALTEPELRRRFDALGIEPVGNTPEEFAAQIRADMARWQAVVERAKIKAD
ncbi:MAG: Bug family tripartite tricarboxylate transporter substrate binding protein [Burkholderiales bacterium]